MPEQLRVGEFSPTVSAPRARIRDAVMELVVERGFKKTTIKMVVERAGVLSSEFGRDFDNLRDCCVRVYLANIDEFDRVVFGAAEGESDWRARLRAAGYAAARHVERRPLETRFDMVAMLTVGEVAQAFRDKYIERIVDLIDEGRWECDDPGSCTREVAVGVFGSIYEMLLKRLHERENDIPAESMVPELMYIAVRPYLGYEVALEELRIGPPAGVAGDA